ncbi:MAG: D-2-hydroxyacid dehydrogenase [Lachnospiraceae bacterium]
MKKILVTIPVEQKHKEYLEKIGEGMKFEYAHRAAGATREQVQNANIILGNVKVDDLRGAKNLEFLQLDSAGAAQFTEPGLLGDGVKLCNATGAYGRSIAEHMLAQVFALKKKLNIYQDNMKEHLWRDEGKVTTIFGSTTLVLGLGDIGGEFAKRMHALGSYVIGIRRNKADKPEYLDELHQMDKLEELLPKADIVACSLPGTKATYHLFDSKTFMLMKKNCILLNVGRGNLIATEELIKALDEGVIGGAAIDVAEVEPLPTNSPLWNTKNLLITPHIAGNYHTQDILDTAVSIAGENLRAYLAGKPLKNEVDFETGYRKFVK